MRAGTRRALLLLLALLAVLAAQRAGVLDPAAGASAGAGAPTAAPAPAPADAPVPLPPQERYAVIEERPLFMPTRRPPAPPPPQPAATAAAPRPAPPPPDLEVHAIVREGERWLAMLSRARGTDFVQAEPGDEVHGWTVTSIGPEVVELRSGARNVRLRLRPEVTLPR